MHKELINNIQKNLLKLTNNKISKKIIEKKIIPIFFYINNSKKNMFLISGSQGIGKTTFLEILRENYMKYFKKRILTLSLDDFYLSKKERILLSKKIHPLFLTRGVPGTHNTNEILEIINKFENSQYPIRIPIFNKIKDDRIAKKRIIYNKSDILILEGWCCGSKPLHETYLKKNINYLEKKFDKKFIWRNYYNQKLKNEYKKIFDRFKGGLIFFKAPSFLNVLKWRLKQEQKNRKNYKSIKIGMSKEDIREFIQHYEKITKWMIKTLTLESNITIYLNNNQNIKKINLN